MHLEYSQAEDGVTLEAIMKSLKETEEIIRKIRPILISSMRKNMYANLEETPKHLKHSRKIDG